MNIKIFRKNDICVLINMVSYIRVSDSKLTLESDTNGESFCCDLNSVLKIESI